MPLIEYKLHRDPEKGNVVPGFVERHLGLRNNNLTYVGYIRPSDQRNFYVPDTVTVLDRDAFIARELARVDLEADGLTEEEVTERAGELYDQHIVGEE